jgi:hypothetical protein
VGASVRTGEGSPKGKTCSAPPPAKSGDNGESVLRLLHSKGRRFTPGKGTVDAAERSAEKAAGVPKRDFEASGEG